MNNPIGRLCDTGAKHGADVAIRPMGRWLSCVYECPQCGQTLDACHVADDNRIMFNMRTRIKTTRNVRLACAIIGRNLGKEHKCATSSPTSHTEQSQS